jgi:hypothetical protein
MGITREQLLELARQITGQADYDAAVGETIKGYIAKKLAEYERAIRRYERKYGMSFTQFTAKLQDKQFVQRLEAEQGIVNLEDDYFEWEGLISEVEYLRRKMQELTPLSPPAAST